MAHVLDLVWNPVFWFIPGGQVHVGFGLPLGTLGLILGPLGLIWAPLATILHQQCPKRHMYLTLFGNLIFRFHCRVCSVIQDGLQSCLKAQNGVNLA